jgi:endonuclease G
MKKLLVAILFLALFVAYAGWLQHTPQQVQDIQAAPAVPVAQVSRSQSQHTLGIPTDNDPRDDVLIEHTSFLVSWNPYYNVPNFVAWKLDRRDNGSAERAREFVPDPLLPKKWTSTQTSDFLRSGFDRGHLCPAKDRSRDTAFESETFVLTNIAPQLHSLNAGPWLGFESHERDLALKYQNVYIVAGTINSKKAAKLNNIYVPTAFWKEVVFWSGDVQNAQAEAVRMPHQEGLNRDWRAYRTSVREIESETEYNFNSELSRVLQDKIER